MTGLSYVKLVLLASIASALAVASASPVAVKCKEVDPKRKFSRVGEDLWFQNFGPKIGPGGRSSYLGMELTEHNHEPGKEWVYGNMVFKAEVQTGYSALTYQISINKDGSPPPVPTVDGTFTVTYYNKQGDIIRSFYISHADTCNFEVDARSSFELSGDRFAPDGRSVKLSRYDPTK